MECRLGQVWIGSYKLKSNLARFSRRPSIAVASKKSIPPNILKSLSSFISNSEKGLKCSYADIVHSHCNIEAIQSHSSVNPVGSDEATGSLKEQDPEFH
ncbi:hypothetical protein Ancab_016205, partial [Ancistrocladus abbreviatus]